MRIALALTASLMLTACSKIPSTDANIEARGIEQINEMLFDADSAKFRNLKVAPFAKDKTQKLLCGEVNAKGTMGGYVGYTRFIAKPDADEASLESLLQPDQNIVIPLIPYEGDTSKMDACEQSRLAATQMPQFKDKAEQICTSLQEAEINKQAALDFIAIWDSSCKGE